MKWFCFLLLFFAGNTFAQTQEEKAQQIFHELRCMVCQGQSIAESDAKLAVDMRVYVRRAVEEGKTREEILEYLRARYGDTVQLSAQPQGFSRLVWIAPFALLISWLAYSFWRIKKLKRRR